MLLHSSFLAPVCVTRFIKSPRPELLSAPSIPLVRPISVSTRATKTVVATPGSEQSKGVSLSSVAVLPPCLFSIPPPEVALLSVFFVLSMAAAAMFSLIIISIPAMTAFRRLSTSMEKLLEVVSEEVPGTLKLLKLFGQEVYDLTQLLSKLRRQKTSASYHSNRDGANKSNHFRN